ncbi:MAG: hypothetical protein EA362_10215 [Saprospirales bacterium]|nr:MAG: hypothetical protein EA362_10215 [Saprospirales bacterium]
MHNKINPITLILILFFCFSNGKIKAQFSGDEMPIISTDLFISNVTMKSHPGADYEKTNLLIQNGIINQIGSEIKAPASAKTIDGEGLHLYSAFINPLSHEGLKDEEDDVRRSAWRGAPGTTPLSHAGINPQNSIIDEFDLNSRGVESLHKQGFGLIHLVPRGFVMTGKGTFFLIKEKEDDNSHVLVSETGLFAQWRNMARVYPATPLATMAVWRDLINNTRLQLEYSESIKQSPEGKARLNVNNQTLALFPVVKKEQVIYFNVPENRQILRAVRLAEELDLDIILTNVSQLDASILSTLPENIQFFPDLSWPEHPHEEKTEKSEKVEEKERPNRRKRRTAEKQEKPEEDKSVPVGMTEEEHKKLLESRTKEYERRMNLAAELKNRNALLGFSMLDTKTADLLKNCRTLLEFGFTADEILAALTTDVATHFGIDAITGTVNEGKQAHLVLFDKSFTEDKATVQYMIIDGKLFSYKKDEK